MFVLAFVHLNSKRLISGLVSLLLTKRLRAFSSYLELSNYTHRNLLNDCYLLIIIVYGNYILFNMTNIIGKVI